MKKNLSPRPPEKTPRPFLASLLSSIRKLTGGNRFENLYDATKSIILSLNVKNIRLLDYGCGTMSFSSRLKDDGLISEFIGMDIYAKPLNIENEHKWENYIQIKSNGILKGLGKFDFALLIDVLHHAKEEDQEIILRELSLVSSLILVKDHFEYGLISRSLLRLADWYGNYAYGVSIPRKYFNKESWYKLVQSAGLIEAVIEKNIRVHDGIFGIIIRPKNHFISILKQAV